MKLAKYLCTRLLAGSTGGVGLGWWRRATLVARAVTGAVLAVLDTDDDLLRMLLVVLGVVVGVVLLCPEGDARLLGTAVVASGCGLATIHSRDSEIVTHYEVGLRGRQGW